MQIVRIGSESVHHVSRRWPGLRSSFSVPIPGSLHGAAGLGKRSEPEAGLVRGRWPETRPQCRRRVSVASARERGRSSTTTSSRPPCAASPTGTATSSSSPPRRSTTTTSKTSRSASAGLAARGRRTGARRGVGAFGGPARLGRREERDLAREENVVLSRRPSRT